MNRPSFWHELKERKLVQWGLGFLAGAWVTLEFADFLGGCELVATGTTGARLTAEVGLVVERMLSGPHGGDLQIGARLAVGQIDAVVFLRDPMTPQPHEPDINALVRACDVHDVACATNVASGRLMLRSLQVLGAAGGGRE